MARNCHKSVVAGTILAGATPHFVYPELDAGLMMTLNLSFDAVKQAVEAHPWIKVLFITSPNYYGICADIKSIVPYAREKGMTVLVDEAHGPHLGFHPELPVSALSVGADLCVQSTHKIIGGMTQASMMHARGGRVDMDTVTGVLKFAQTTSPSYILMASLDLARMQMATEGEKLLGKALKLARGARQAINQVPGLYCLEKDAVLGRGMGDMDETKLAINVSGLGMSGYDVSRLLNVEHDIQVEMADPFHILVIVSIGDRREDLDRLVAALGHIAGQRPVGGKPTRWEEALPKFRNVPGLTPREAFFAAHELVSVDGASGRLSTEIVTVYPPGIPLLVPGEVITDEVISYLDRVLELGGTVDGLSDDGRVGVVR
jgi:arginine decarboxylase